MIMQDVIIGNLIDIHGSDKLTVLHHRCAVAKLITLWMSCSIRKSPTLTLQFLDQFSHHLRLVWAKGGGGSSMIRILALK